jgi:HAMP domain-containing protein
MNTFGIVLLIINSVLVLSMLAVLFAVLWQGRRIERLARQAQELADEAERHRAAGHKRDEEHR